MEKRSGKDRDKSPMGYKRKTDREENIENTGGKVEGTIVFSQKEIDRPYRSEKEK